jgi:central kinetochore subunit Mal2/MCM21
VQDPDPNAVDGGNVLGIRFDIFAAGKREFETPYYVLLTQPERDGRLKVHKHTVPVFIPIQVLVKRHLPYAAATGGEEDAPVKAGLQMQDLPKFVRALRKELVAHHKWVEAFERLKKCLGKRQGVEEVKMLDPSGKEIEIVFTKNIVARLRVATDGTIEKVAVGPAPSLSAERNHDASAMKSYREIKKVIEGGEGRIDDLVERLRRRVAG